MDLSQQIRQATRKRARCGIQQTADAWRKKQKTKRQGEEALHSQNDSHSASLKNTLLLWGQNEQKMK